MAKFPHFDHSRPKLYALQLGGKAEKSNLEVHDVVFVVAKNRDEVAAKVRDKWFGTPSSLHVDSWYPVEEVDDYQVILEMTSTESQSSAKLKLFFVNLGAYIHGHFGEQHFMSFEVATSKAEARTKAMGKIDQDLFQPHLDNMIDMDDCLELSEVDSYHIVLKKKEISSPNPINSSPTNGFQRL